VLYIAGWSIFIHPLFRISQRGLVQTMNHVVADGKSNWLEGIILIGEHTGWPESAATNPFVRSIRDNRCLILVLPRYGSAIGAYCTSMTDNELLADHYSNHLMACTETLT